jgi:hypothetical protein
VAGAFSFNRRNEVCFCPQAKQLARFQANYVLDPDQPGELVWAANEMLQ